MGVGRADESRRATRYSIRIGSPRRRSRAAKRPAIARTHSRSDSWQAFWRAVSAIVPSAFKYGCIAWGLTKAAQVLIAWTGHDTEANVNLSILVKIMSHRVAGYSAPWLVVFAIWILYRRERRLKEDAISMFGEGPHKFESPPGPIQTASQLPVSRETNPRDPP